MISLHIFIKLLTYFCTCPIEKPTLSQINLVKNAKNNFLLLKKLKNTEIAQLCTVKVFPCLCQIIPRPLTNFKQLNPFLPYARTTRKAVDEDRINQLINLILIHYLN